MIAFRKLRQRIGQRRAASFHVRELGGESPAPILELTSRIAGMFWLDAQAVPGHTAEELLPAVQAVLDEVKKNGVTAAEVERAVRLVDQAEYKRRQAPPGIKITERAFGRDRRMPITNRYRG